MKQFETMTWFSEEMKRLSAKRESNMNHPLSKKNDQPENHIESIVLIITNMRTDEDFTRIKQEFLQADGIIDVSPYTKKKIKVTYDKRKTSLRHLATILERTGYKYIKRACKSCVRE
jgi:hypothetical protein